MSSLRKVSGILKRYGPLGFVRKALEKMKAPDRNFNAVKQHFYASEEELKSQRIAEGRFPYRPLISVCVPVYKTRPEFLSALIESLLAQTYTLWELVLSDGSPDDSLRSVAERYEDERIRYFKQEQNYGISGNTNAASAEAKGEYLAFLDHDDLLTPNALYEYVYVLNRERFDLLYSDEDKITEDGSGAFQPHFKSDYNYLLLLSNNYICHFTMVSRTLTDRLEADFGQLFQSAFDGSQDYDFILRCIEKTDRICHIPKILYHWRESAGSTAGDSYAKTYTEDAGLRAVKAHLERTGQTSEVTPRLEIGCYRIDPLPTEKTGIIGAKTICGRKVDSCGLFYDEDGVIRHAFRDLPASFKGYCRRAVLQQEVSGVMLSSAEILPEAKRLAGEPDDSLPEPERSMEYCKRVRLAGLRVILDPERVVTVDTWSPEGHAPSENKRDPYFEGVQKALKMIK